MSKKTEVRRITSKEELGDLEIQKLLLKFFASNKLVRDPVAAFVELVGRIEVESLALFVARNGKEKWHGAILAQWSTSAMNPACVVLHLYVEPEKGVRTALVNEVIDYARLGGYDNIVTIDCNNKPKAYARLFGAHGQPTELGSVFNFDLGEGLL